MSMAITTQAAKPNSSRVYQVSDYASVAPVSDYVLVRHYRTVQRAGGQTAHEPILSSEELLTSMISAFGGELHEVSETLYGFFDDPERARYCAEAISTYHGRQAEVTGSQLSITL